jgi:hypothetical protein
MNIISKNEINNALNSIGLKKISQNGSICVYKNENFQFEVDTLFLRYVRTPTKKRTYVKFNSCEELVSKISKLFSNLEKEQASFNDLKNFIANQKSNIKEKMLELAKIYPFSITDSYYYYNDHKIEPRLYENGDIHFRAIISRNIFDLTPEQLINTFDLISSFKK